MFITGWFVDRNTSNDWHFDLFSSALSAAMNLTRGHTFEAMHENVSVRFSLDMDSFRSFLFYRISILIPVFIEVRKKLNQFIRDMSFFS